ncbi:MAG: Holliday junction branch migration protein RuvA, partial [Corynebacterium matruchotii]
MIVSLRGTVIDITAHHAVIECAGVGYQVLATPSTLGHLTRGAETFILITMIVREESQTLYGFLDAATRDMFATLQTVSGLGPKLALVVRRDRLEHRADDPVRLGRAAGHDGRA